LASIGKEFNVSISRDAMISWVQTFADVIHEKKAYLTELDSAIGDADHGVNMNRGMQAVTEKLPGVADKDIGSILKTVGMTLVSTVGGASGPLYGTFFMKLGSTTAGKEELTLADWVEALEAGVEGVKKRGKAQPGDKTMLDALIPALDALREAADGGADMDTALRASVKAAEEGRDATIPLVAKKGRASYLGERSAGHVDPGATSSHLMLKTALDTWVG
jgi:dihydroxyacetone kinase-like protein